MRDPNNQAESCLGVVLYGLTARERLPDVSPRKPRQSIFAGASPYRLFPPPLSAKWRRNDQNLRFFRGIRPLPPFLLAGGGGVGDEKKLDVRVLLALRQFPGLAQGGALPV